MNPARRRRLCSPALKAFVLVLVFSFVFPFGAESAPQESLSSEGVFDSAEWQQGITPFGGETRESKVESLKGRQQHPSKRPPTLDIAIPAPIAPPSVAGEKAEVEFSTVFIIDSPALSLVKGRSPPSV